MTFVGCMCFFYLLYTFFLSTLGHSVAVAKQENVATAPNADAILNLVSICLILVCSIWYLGWLGGVVAFAFCIASLPHATYGWLFPFFSSLNCRRIANKFGYYAAANAVRLHIARSESWFMVLTGAYFVFLVTSFFSIPFSAFRSWWTLPHILIFAVVCAVGFISRIIFGRKLPTNPLPDEDSVLY